MEPEGSLRHSQQPATCLYPELTHSSLCHHIPLSEVHLNIILPSTPWSSKWLFPSGFPTKTLCTPLLFTIRATCYAHLILLDLIIRTIMDEEYRSLSSFVMFFSPFPCYFVPLEPKYSPQHLILKHPQPTFLPRCE